MPPAARLADVTAHGLLLNVGPGSLDVKIGYMPAWRAVPSGMGAGIEKASETMKDFMGTASFTPGETPSKLAEVFAALGQDAGKAASNGAPGAPGGAAGGAATAITANVALSAIYVTAAAVPGGEPAAKMAYTQGIKAAGAAAASAAMSAMAGVADMHFCGIPCPIPPHGPGLVTKGSKSVFINGLPAAREGDKVFEACGGSDPIQLGCQTVLIGDDGGGPASGAGAAAVAQAVEEAAEQAQAQSTTQALVAAAQSGTPLVEVCPQCAKMKEAAQEKKHWVAFRVVDDVTDETLAGVELKITLPDGSVESRTTDHSGTVHTDEIESPGTCAVESQLQNARREQTYDFVGMGETRISEPDPQAEQQTGRGQPKPQGRKIAEIEEHKVRTGETLQSLAQQNGRTWQQLAKFNWDTDVPDRINEHLRDEVGCSKKTADGRNYRFDDSDNPGILLIPKAWKEEGLATDQEHTVRVRYVQIEPPFRFSI